MDETDFQSKQGAFGTINHLVELISTVSSRFQMVLKNDPRFENDKLANQIGAIEKQLSSLKLAIESSSKVNEIEDYS